MKAPAHELALYLASAGIGAFGGMAAWSINVSREPVSPDDAVTLYDTGGAAPALIDEQLRRPTIQVRVRGRSYPDAYAKQEAIAAALRAIIDQDIDTSHYLGVWQTSDIISIGRDDNDRHLLTANYEIHRQPL